MIYFKANHEHKIFLSINSFNLGIFSRGTVVMLSACKQIFSLNILTTLIISSLEIIHLNIRENTFRKLWVANNVALLSATNGRKIIKAEKSSADVYIPKKANDVRSKKGFCRLQLKSARPKIVIKYLIRKPHTAQHYVLSGRAALLPRDSPTDIQFLTSIIMALWVTFLSFLCSSWFVWLACIGKRSHCAAG